MKSLQQVGSAKSVLGDYLNRYSVILAAQEHITDIELPSLSFASDNKLLKAFSRTYSILRDRMPTPLKKTLYALHVHKLLAVIKKRLVSLSQIDIFGHNKLKHDINKHNEMIAKAIMVYIDSNNNHVKRSDVVARKEIEG